MSCWYMKRRLEAEEKGSVTTTLNLPEVEEKKVEAPIEEKKVEKPIVKKVAKTTKKK